MKNKTITRVCYPANLYMLLQYLLISTPEEIDNTFFFFTGNRFDTIRKKIKNHKFFIFDKLPRALRILLWLPYWGWYMLAKNFLWPFLRHSKLFINDHHTWGYILGKKYKYNLLEDGLALYAGTLVTPPAGKIRSFLLSPFPQGCWGRNNNCDTIYMTKPLNTNAHFAEKNIIVGNFKNLWDESTEQKKKMILDIFDVSEDDVKLIEKHTNLLLTQPFSECGFLEFEEEIQCLQKMIADLGLKDFLIKKHPGEKKDYKEIFPTCDVYDKKVPIELFVLLGCNFTKIVAICSTAVMIFQDKAEIVWYGEKFSETLNKKIATSIPEQLK